MPSPIWIFSECSPPRWRIFVVHYVFDIILGPFHCMPKKFPLSFSFVLEEFINNGILRCAWELFKGDFTFYLESYTNNKYFKKHSEITFFFVLYILKSNFSFFKYYYVIFYIIVIKEREVLWLYYWKKYYFFRVVLHILNFKLFQMI